MRQIRCDVIEVPIHLWPHLVIPDWLFLLSTGWATFVRYRYDHEGD